MIHILDHEGIYFSFSFLGELFAKMQLVLSVVHPLVSAAADLAADLLVGLLLLEL